MNGRARMEWTRQALWCTLAGWASLAVGAWLGSRTLVAGGAALLFWVLADALLTAGHAPTVRLQVTPQRVPENQGVTAELEMAGLRRRHQVRLLLDPGLGLPPDATNLAAGFTAGAHVQSVRVQTPLRGARLVGPVEVRYWSPSRLWARQWTLGEAVPIEVLPSSEDVRRLGLLSRVVKPLEGRYSVNRPGSGFDFFTLRGYTTGDTQRSVNWKASARQEDDLIVNQRQRETLTELTILVDGRLVSGVGPLGQSPLDRACRLALGLYVQGLRNRDIVRLACYGEGVARPPPGGDRLHTCEQFLARLQPAGAAGLREAWDAVHADIKAPGPIMVLSSLEGDAGAAPAIADMVARHHPVTVVSPTPTGPSWSADAARQQRRNDLIREVRRSGAVVVDWLPATAVEAEKPVIGGVVA
jgi:uncharacterized protein (DUF58 family)